MKPYLNPIRVYILLLVSLFLITSCQPAAGTQPTETTAPAAAIQPTQTQAPAASPTAAEKANAISAEIFLDPALAQDADSLLVNQYLYAGLVQLDANGKVQPALAESWVISDDQLDYIFKLRSNAAFSDGTFITPDIVVANFNRWFEPTSPLRGGGDFAAWKRIFLGFHGEKDTEDRPKSFVDGIQKVDFNTVLIHLNRQEPKLLDYLADPAFAILKPEALEAGNYGKNKGPIISSGAYVIGTWDNSGLTLSPNPKYWGTAPTEDLKFTWR
jgi:ABC-type transport system substrate-binding protein